MPSIASMIVSGLIPFLMRITALFELERQKARVKFSDKLTCWAKNLRRDLCPQYNRERIYSRMMIISVLPAFPRSEDSKLATLSTPNQQPSNNLTPAVTRNVETSASKTPHTAQEGPKSVPNQDLRASCATGAR